MNIVSSDSKNPLYLDLYLKLLGKIESGEYPVGSKLPSEKLIAEENGVSRITSKHALDRLAGEGYIQRFPGKGSFIRARSVSGTAPEQAAPHAVSVRNSRLIGVIMENLQSDFGTDILLGIEKKCAEAGCSMLLKFSYGDENREKACIEELLAAGVSGILLMCVYSEVYSSAVMKLALEGFPMVFMDRSLNGLPIPYVGTNHRDAAIRLTGELIACGHQNIVLVMDEDSHTTSSAEERVQGYVQCCIDHNLLCANKRLLLQHDNMSDPQEDRQQNNIQRIRDYMRDNPDTTAILSLSAEITAILLHALGRSATARYTFASFDGPRGVMSNPYKLLYIAQGQKDIGRTACAHLLDRIDGKDVPMITEVPYSLVVSPAAQD